MTGAAEMAAGIQKLDSLCAADKRVRDCEEVLMLKQYLLEQRLEKAKGLMMSDLYRIPGIESRISELEIDWRDLPELAHLLREPELPQKLRDKTGRNEFFVKDFEAQGWYSVVRFIPLSSTHIEALKLTSEQIEEMLDKFEASVNP